MWVVGDDQACLLIDPAHDPAKVVEAVGGPTLTAVHTPGHCPGSVCFTAPGPEAPGGQPPAGRGAGGAVRRQRWTKRSAAASPTAADRTGNSAAVR